MQLTRNRTFVVAGLAVVAVVSLIGWKALANRQPKLTASGDKLRTFVASDKFKALPPEEQKQYAQAMFKSGPVELKDDKPTPEQEAAMQNAAGAHRQAMLAEYFGLPEGKPRKDYLDKQIDQQERIKKMMENADSAKPSDGPRIVMKKRGSSGAAGQKAMAESVPPDQQAKLAQYMKDFQARRAERGLPPGPGGVMIMITNGPK
jgi:hypothetical protein